MKLNFDHEEFSNIATTKNGFVEMTRILRDEQGLDQKSIDIALSIAGYIENDEDLLKRKCDESWQIGYDEGMSEAERDTEDAVSDCLDTAESNFMRAAEKEFEGNDELLIKLRNMIEIAVTF